MGMRQLIFSLLLACCSMHNAIAKELEIDSISKAGVFLHYQHVKAYIGSFPASDKLEKPDIVFVFKSNSPIQESNNFFLFVPKSDLPHDTEKQIGLKCGESYLYRNKNIHLAIDSFSDCNPANYNTITKGLTGYILTFADQTGNIEKIYLTRDPSIPPFVMQKLKEMENAITIIAQEKLYRLN